MQNSGKIIAVNMMDKYIEEVFQEIIIHVPVGVILLTGIGINVVDQNIDLYIHSQFINII